MARQVVIQEGGAAPLTADDHEVGQHPPTRIERSCADAPADPYPPERVARTDHLHARAPYVAALCDDSGEAVRSLVTSTKGLPPPLSARPTPRTMVTRGTFDGMFYALTNR